MEEALLALWNSLGIPAGVTASGMGGAGDLAGASSGAAQLAGSGGIDPMQFANLGGSDASSATSAAQDPTAASTGAGGFQWPKPGFMSAGKPGFMGGKPVAGSGNASGGMSDPGAAALSNDAPQGGFISRGGGGMGGFQAPNLFGFNPQFPTVQKTPGLLGF